MKKLIAILAAVTMLWSCCGQKDTHLPRAIDPEAAQHIDSVFMSVPLSGSVNEIHSLIVVKDGKIIYERYDAGQRPDNLHTLWSASKPYTATAIGFAVEEGLLSVDDKVVSYLSEDEIPVYEDSLHNVWLNSLTIKHLLTMSSGFEKDYLAKAGAGVLESPLRATLEGGIVFEPGYRFSYNSMNPYILSAIISKVTGQTVEEYLTPRLFEPLGIRNHVWELSTEGYSKGGWGLHLTTESFAKMGMLYLQNGVWEGKQIISSDWVKEASANQIATARFERDPDWKEGYGYQFWRNTIKDSYRLDGAWGQFCVVLPNENAVVACNCHTWGTSQLLDAIWRYVYPIISE